MRSPSSAGLSLRGRPSGPTVESGANGLTWRLEPLVPAMSEREELMSENETPNSVTATVDGMRVGAVTGRVIPSVDNSVILWSFKSLTKPVISSNHS